MESGIMKATGLWVWGLAALFSVSLIVAGEGLAGDADTVASGSIAAMDANQGSGTQTNADVWEDIGNAVAGSGNQSSDTDGSANTGSGDQVNAESDADGWNSISNANNGSGEQISNSENSNGGDRISNDLVIGLGVAASIADGALESSVSGNSMLASGSSSDLDSNLSITSDSGFSSMSGVNAIAATSAGNASQSVGVNVTATVTTY